jgi:hypothetical protein
MKEQRVITILAPEDVIPGGDTAGDHHDYFSLATGEKLPVAEEDAGSDRSWHIAFKRSFIKVNSGLAGPGGGTVALLDPPDDSPREEFLQLTDADFQRKFHAVTAVPNDATFVDEGIEPALFGWRVEKDGVWKAPVSKGWKLRLADGTSFAKLRVIDVAADGKTITADYSFQPEKDGTLEPAKTAVIASGEYFNVREGNVVEPKGTNWDIHHGGDMLFLNSSVSGPGKAGALGSKRYGPIWDSIDNPSDGVAFFMDEFGSAFRNPKWYRYNLDGNHDLHVNGAVYGVKTNDGIYKVQVSAYFEHGGSDVGNFKVRFARIG